MREISRPAGESTVSRTLPKGSWDAQVHVFGGPYPLSANRSYEPPSSSDFDAMIGMHQKMGFEYGVVVQASAQGFETRYVADVLRRVPQYAGVILMNDDISDRELDGLHDAGVRGGRFTFLPGFEVKSDVGTLRKSLARIQERGWFAKIFATSSDWVSLKPYLDDVEMPIIIDHLGYIDPAAGPGQPAMGVILDLLSKENWWMMLSCGYRISKKGDCRDVIPYAEAFIKAAPDRVLWGSDWPHVNCAGAEPSDQQVLDELFKYTTDSAQIEKILSHNPAKIFKRA
jgi:2-pyrone-4,6-dicarboxylate lactonase